MVTSVWVATQFPKRIIFGLFKEQLHFSKMQSWSAENYLRSRRQGWMT